MGALKVALLAPYPRPPGGLHQYTATLIEALCDLAEQGAPELAVVQRSDYDGMIAGRAPTSVVLRGLHAHVDTLLAVYPGTGIRACKARRFDVAVSPRASLAALRSGRRSVVTLHDLQHRRLPQFFSRRRRLLRDWLYSRAVTSADRVVC